MSERNFYLPRRSDIIFVMSTIYSIINVTLTIITFGVVCEYDRSAFNKDSLESMLYKFMLIVWGIWIFLTGLYFSLTNLWEIASESGQRLLQ